MISLWKRRRAEKNRKKSQTFLAENQKKEGVIVLPSGLQYKVLREGTGASPEPNDTIVTHYRGTLINGKEFDSSYHRRGPVTSRISRMIPGWAEALPLMKVGAKWQLFIPPHLAYGQHGAGRKIGPNAVLIFEVELLAIESNRQK